MKTTFGHLQIIKRGSKKPTKQMGRTGQIWEVEHKTESETNESERSGLALLARKEGSLNGSSPLEQSLGQQMINFLCSV